jgi:hypothetical protein
LLLFFSLAVQRRVKVARRLTSSEASFESQVRVYKEFGSHWIFFSLPFGNHRNIVFRLVELEKEMNQLRSGLKAVEKELRRESLRVKEIFIFKNVG